MIRTITIIMAATIIIASRITTITTLITTITTITLLTTTTPPHNPTVRTCPSSHRANSCN